MWSLRSSSKSGRVWAQLMLSLLMTLLNCCFINYIQTPKYQNQWIWSNSFWESYQHLNNLLIILDYLAKSFANNQKIVQMLIWFSKWVRSYSLILIFWSLNIIYKTAIKQRHQKRKHELSPHDIPDFELDLKLHIGSS